MKKQKVFIILNLALFFTMLNQNNIVIATSYNPPVIINNVKLIDKKAYKPLKEKKHKKNEIVSIKKQIQERKKLHRNLLTTYNINFDSNILTSITNNSLQIEMLVKIKTDLIRKKESIT